MSESFSADAKNGILVLTFRKGGIYVELSLALMQNIGSMLLWVVVGYIVVKTGMVAAEHSRVLSSLTVYVFCPCLIFSAFQIDLTQERIRGFLFAMGFAFVVYFIWILIARMLRKPFSLDPVDEMSLVYSNVGNLVLPLVAMTLGDEMVFYASAIQVPFNLLFWTHAISVIREEKHLEWKKIFSNFNVIALVLGLATLLSQVRIPSVLMTSIHGLRDMVAPASMIVVGMVLASTSLKSIFTCSRAYAILLGRLILFPLVAMGVLYVSGIPIRYPQLAGVLLVTFMSLSAPPASNISQVAVVFHKNETEASIYNILGLFFCIITIPLIIALYQILFL